MQRAGFLGENEKNFKVFLQEFMLYCSDFDPIEAYLMEWHPRIIWGQLLQVYPKIGADLMEV